MRHRFVISEDKLYNVLAASSLGKFFHLGVGQRGAPIIPGHPHRAEVPPAKLLDNNVAICKHVS